MTLSGSALALAPCVEGPRLSISPAWPVCNGQDKGQHALRQSVLMAACRSCFCASEPLATTAWRQVSRSPFPQCLLLAFVYRQAFPQSISQVGRFVGIVDGHGSALCKVLFLVRSIAGWTGEESGTALGGVSNVGRTGRTIIAPLHVRKPDGHTSKWQSNGIQSSRCR